MARQLVIVRQFDGRPLRRLALGAHEDRVYISSERAIHAAESGDLPPVAFEKTEVFDFDEHAFQLLLEAWNESGVVDTRQWQSLQPYQTDSRTSTATA